MGLENLKAGEHVPDDFNVVIEIQAYSKPIKYEVDKETGMLFVDRFLGTCMTYPCEYGFIPHTLSDDGDPVDVLVVSPFPLQPGSFLRCRAVGMLRMVDDAGIDTKILAVPVTKLTPLYQHVQEAKDLGKEYLDRLEHFFKHYKDLEPGKWSKIEGWGDQKAAKQVIKEGVERYNSKKNNA